MSRPHRLLPGAAAATALAVAAAGFVGATSTAQAVEGSTTVTFQDCELEVGGFPAGTPKSLTTPVTVDYPSPVRTYQEQAATMTLGTLPANFFPDDLGDSYVYAEIAFDDGTGSEFYIYEEKRMASFDAGSPFVLGEFEHNLQFTSSGLKHFEPKRLYLWLYGDPGDGSRYYEYRCDPLLDATSIITTAIFDPDADAAVRLNEIAAKQGGTVLIAGTDFAHESPDDPDGDVTVTVGGVPAGTYDVDETGAFTAALRVPDFVQPGDSVVVRASSQGEVATTQLSVRARKGTVKVAPGSAKSGKKVSVKASGFKPGEKVKITLSGGKGSGTKSYSTSAKVNASGNASKAVKLKKAAKGKWKVKVAGPQSFRKAAKGFTVT